MLRSILVLAAGFAATGARAQNSPDMSLATPKDGAVRYTPDFFSQYGPVSALDMVIRVPGFNIDEGADRRGFADTGGNILIDGERPSTKSENIRSVLSRISVDQVERIDLIDSVGSFSDARGQSRVVNVVRKSAASLSGTYDATIATNESGRTRPFGSGSLTYKRGSTTYDVNASYFNFYGVSAGPESVFTLPRALQERRDQRTVNKFNEAVVGGKVKTTIGSTKLNANAKVEFDWGSFNRVGDSYSAANQYLGRENFGGRDPKLQIGYEAGGDIEFSLASALKAKIISLYTRESNDNDSLIRFAPAAGPARFNSTANESLSQEAIARVQVDWTAGKAHNVQFGNEIALNKLSFASQTAFDNGSGAGIRVLPSSAVRVREWRAEPFVSDVWSLRPDFKLEAGLVVEFSRLTVAGDNANTRNFRFLKPRAVLTYDWNTKTKVTLRAEREAAQLDFFDFATSVELGEDRVNAGNPDLVPERLWKFEGTVERRFGDKGALSVSGFYARVTDTQDLVPVLDFAAPGNIGASRRWGGNASITLPLSEFMKSPWLSGVELKWTTSWRGSRVNDPVTLRTRPRSDEQKLFNEVNFRHDFPQIGWSYGADIYFGSGRPFYYFDEIQTFKNGTEVFAFVEYKKFPLGTLQFKINNFTGAKFQRLRTLFEPTRAGAATTFIQRLRNNERRFLLTLSGKF
jgi:hypothetical protein